MRLHWGRGWWGRWCQHPDLPWRRRLDKHRGSPPRSAGARWRWGSALGWWTRTDLDCSGNVLRSPVAQCELRQEKEKPIGRQVTVQWSGAWFTYCFWLWLTKIRHRQHLQSVIVMEFIPFMSSIADITADVSAEPLIPVWIKQLVEFKSLPWMLFVCRQLINQ